VRLPDLTLIVAHRDPAVLDQIIDSLDDRHRVLSRCDSVHDLKAAVLQHHPDLIITDAELNDGSAVDACIGLNEDADEPMPVLIVTAERTLGPIEKALEDNVMAYMVTPFDSAGLNAHLMVAVERHRQLMELRDEVDDLQQALEDRRVVQRCKAALMKQHGMTEDEAYAAIRRRAQDGRTRMLLAAAHLLDELAGLRPADDTP